MSIAVDGSPRNRHYRVMQIAVVALGVVAGILALGGGGLVILGSRKPRAIPEPVPIRSRRR